MPLQMCVSSSTTTRRDDKSLPFDVQLADVAVAFDEVQEVDDPGDPRCWSPSPIGRALPHDDDHVATPVFSQPFTERARSGAF